MNTPSNVSPTFLKPDESHLNLLSVFHYVFAGLGLLGGLGMVAHYWFMNAIMTGQIGASANQPAPPPEFFIMMKVMYVVFAVFLIVGIVLNVLSAVFLRQRRYRVFSMVVAGTNCLQIPFGTTLGVFTFIVSMRESVREGYDQSARQN